MVTCDGCEREIEEGAHFYILSKATCNQNDNKVWDYDKDEDAEMYCLPCSEFLVFMKSKREVE